MEKTYLWENSVPMARGDLEEDKPSLTPFLVDSMNAPAFIVLPGGGYNHLARHEGEPIARWLNANGISAFVLHYRVAPYEPQVALLDAKRAIRLIKYNASQWKIDVNRIGVIGFSAGGHLAAMLGTEVDTGETESEDLIERVSCRPQLLVLCYPFISVSSKRGIMHEEFMPDRRVTEMTPPTFLWHTFEDEKVPVSNSIRFADALDRNGVPYGLHIFTHGRHGLGLAKDHPECSSWTSLCMNWLKQQKFVQDS